MIENGGLASFGILSQSSTLATLISVSEALKWKSSLFSLLAWQWFSPVDCFPSRKRLCKALHNLFRECKQYLRLGKSQNTDFCGQIADVTLTMVAYTILSLYKRFEAYETSGALFRETQKGLLEKKLYQRIEMAILKILCELLELLPIDVEQTIYELTSSEKKYEGVLAMLNAVNQYDDSFVKSRYAS